MTMTIHHYLFNGTIHQRAPAPRRSRVQSFLRSTHHRSSRGPSTSDAGLGPRRYNMGVPAECFCWPIIRATPPACPHHFSEDIDGRVKLYIQRNLQHVSTEFRGNHQIRTPVKLYIQGVFSRSFGF